MVRVAVGVVLLLSLAGGAAHARDDETAARVAYQEGTRRYALGDYREALDAFKRAYLVFESPALLFNIAQCHRQLGGRADALRFYRLYLETAPEVTDRAEVARTIEELEKALAAAPPASADKPATVTEPTTPTTPSVTARVATVSGKTAGDKTPIYRRWWLWTVAGVVVVGAGVGIGAGVALSSQRALGFEPTLGEVNFALLTAGR